ncbi:hypothetical protein QYE76_015154 [Lolium multiflorum]|uniref:Transposase (putative) gypsy type domain-containing protein n=1 Tax=Lolium multiflorum TaxID=4521 RepID=A0AAD8U6F0_LOLMU|nr:hypothetical protein QYE76_015154 [Lolium multiflorum]
MAAKGWTKSKVTREALLPYISAGIIPMMSRERWRVPATNETEPLPRTGEFVIFMSFLDRGFAVPTSDFLRQLLAFYNIKISDLGPHNVQQISLFVALCECYLGCPPYFPLWVSIFHGRAARVSKSDQSLIPNGGITFQVKSGEAFIDMALPKKAQAQWRKYWFYAKKHTPAGGVAIPQYSPEPSVPRRLNVRSLPREQEELNDCTRSTATEWTEAEYRKALAKITTATFTAFNAKLQPFSEDKPAPARWQKITNHLPPLAGKEPPEMIEGEEGDEDEEEDDGERTESNSEAFSQDFVRRARGSKRGAASSSQSPTPQRRTWQRRRRRRLPRRREGHPPGSPMSCGPNDCARPSWRAGRCSSAHSKLRLGAKQKVLKRSAPARGTAAAKEAEARKAAEAKKVILTVPRSGSTSVLGHTFGVDDDVLLPIPAGSGCSRSSSESTHDGVVSVVVEISRGFA